MTLLQFAVTYAVCWWIVLFMVLPHQAQPEANPGPGHVPSAPANPQLRKKFRWATLLAFIPALALYCIANEAKAADESILHTGKAKTDVLRASGKCKPLSVHKPREDVAARDGFATGDKKVTPATIGGDNPYVPDKFDMPLRKAADSYTSGRPGQQHNLDDSFIRAGDVSVSKDGATTINGKLVAPQDVYPEGCEQGE